MPAHLVMALDDIVTSYDADHRRTIAGLVATKFRDCQILIATHDERFFNYLKDQLEARVWHFTPDHRSLIQLTDLDSLITW